MTFELATSVNVPSLYLLNNNGASLAGAVGSSSGSVSGDAVMYYALAAGTYYLQVYAAVDLPYTLTASLGALPVGSSLVDDAGSSTAIAKALGTIGSTVVAAAGWIGGGADTDDYYSFNVTGTVRFQAKLFGMSDATTLVLRDKNGTSILSASGGTTPVSFSLDLLELVSGLYYLDVNHSAASSTGYNLSVSAASIPDGAGNTSSAAHSLGILDVSTPLAFTDWVGRSDPADWYSFSVSSPAISTTFALSGLTQSAKLTIYDANGTTVVDSFRGSYLANGSFDAGSTTASFAPLALGTYYVAVTPNSATAATPYTFEVTSSPVLDIAGDTFDSAHQVGQLSATPVSFNGFVSSLGYKSKANPGDYFRFTLNSTTVVNARVSAFGAGQWPGHIGLIFADSAGNAISNLSTTSLADSNSDGLLSDSLPAGTYYAIALPRKIFNNPGAYGNYTLDLWTGLADFGVSSIDVAGNDASQAHDLGAISAGGVQFADWISKADADDFYKITLADASVLHIDWFGAAAINGSILIKDIAGVTLSSGALTATSLGSLVTGFTAGTYWIDLHYGSINPAAGTGYNIQVSATSLADTVGDSIDFASDLGTLSGSKTVSEFVGFSDGADYYKFTLAVPSVITLHLRGTSSPSSSSVQAANGSELASFNAQGWLGKSLLAGTYYIAVIGGGILNSDYNPYNLEIVQTPIIDSAGSSLTTAAPLGVLDGSLPGEVTVGGGSGDVVSVVFTSTIRAAGAIAALTPVNSGILDGSVLPFTYTAGAIIPGIAPGKSGVLYNHVGAILVLPLGYRTFATDALDRVTLFGGGADGQVVLSGFGGLAFNASLGAGSVFAAGGNNLVSMYPGAGNQFVSLGDGDDVVVALSGDATVNAGAGNNQILTGTGHVVVNSTGTDLIAAGDIGSPTIIAGANNPTVFLGPGNSMFVGGTGNATVVGGFGDDTINTQGGTQIWLGTANSHVNTTGADTVIHRSGAATVSATTGNDFVFSGTGTLLFVGGSGASTVLGNNAGGVALVLGGSGSLIDLSYGPTHFIGGTGVATVAGFGGSLTVQGGAGQGLYQGGPAGANSITGGAGQSIILGGGAGDVLQAGTGVGDVIQTFTGAATVSAAGTNGTHKLYGGSGPNLIMTGNFSSNVLVGTGATTIVSGVGVDLFAFANGSSNSVLIQDYVSGSDYLSFVGFPVGEIAAALAGATTSLGSQSLTLSDGTHITFQGFTGLTVANFL